MPQEPLDLDRLFRQRMPRRDLIRYTGMGLGVSAILAACKQASTSAGAIPSGSPRPAMDAEPGGLQVFDWSGLRQRRLLPQGGEAVPLGGTTRRPPATRRSSSCSRTTTRLHEGGGRDVLRHRAPVRLPIQGLREPRRDAAVGHLADPELQRSSIPTSRSPGQIDGKQYFIVEDWGFIAPLVPRRQGGSAGGLLVAAVRRPLRRQDLVDRHLGDAVHRRLFLGVPDPLDMTDDELGADARLPDLEEAPRQVLLETSPTSCSGVFKREEVWIGYAWPDACRVRQGCRARTSTTWSRRRGASRGRAGWGCSPTPQNYYHAHAYVDSWASNEGGPVPRGLLLLRAREHERRPSAISAGHREGARASTTSTILEPPQSDPRVVHPRRDVYQQYWSEVLAA